MSVCLGNTLIEMLKKYPLSGEGREATKAAIGLMGRAKLVKGFNEHRKAKRGRKLRDF
jgi:hypothetical protein